MSSSRTRPIKRKSLVLLKILALGNRQIEDGRVVPAREAFRRVRARKATR